MINRGSISSVWGLPSERANPRWNSWLSGVDGSVSFFVSVFSSFSSIVNTKESKEVTVRCDVGRRVKQCPRLPVSEWCHFHLTFDGSDRTNIV